MTLEEENRKMKDALMTIRSQCYANIFYCRNAIYRAGRHGEDSSYPAMELKKTSMILSSIYDVLEKLEKEDGVNYREIDENDIV